MTESKNSFKLSRSDPSLDCEGFVHSVETCGTVDGPGLRFVLFVTGCPLRCVYCHNPDTQTKSSGKKRTAGDVFNQVMRYKNFIKNGGLTISGGEPLTQQRFVQSIFREAKRAGIHTALDTSGCVGTTLRKGLMDEVDLVLLDVKSWSSESHEKITGHPIEPVIEFAREMERIEKPMWIRFVVVPGVTDNDQTIDGIAGFATSLKNVEKVEILPFHKYGEPKYEELGLTYSLTETEEPSDESVEEIRARFRAYGLEVN